MNGQTTPQLFQAILEWQWTWPIARFALVVYYLVSGLSKIANFRGAVSGDHCTPLFGRGHGSRASSTPMTTTKKMTPIMNCIRAPPKTVRTLSPHAVNANCLIMHTVRDETRAGRAEKAIAMVIAKQHVR